MKKKLIVVTTLIAFCMMTAFAVNAMAAAKWYDCSVVNIGVDSSGQCAIRVYNANQDSERMFVPATGQENRMLAVALTALSLTYNVLVNVDSWVNGTTINDIRVSAP
jgi:hypothetical protein